MKDLYISVLDVPQFLLSMTHPDYKFEIGKGTVVREGTDVTIVATGICVDSALGAAEEAGSRRHQRRGYQYLYHQASG